MDTELHLHSWDKYLLSPFWLKSASVLEYKLCTSWCNNLVQVVLSNNYFWNSTGFPGYRKPMQLLKYLFGWRSGRYFTSFFSSSLDKSFSIKTPVTGMKASGW
jgi:hypothetical protein